MPIMDLLCATDTTIGIISLPLMSVIYFDSVASLAKVGRNLLNKHIFRERPPDCLPLGENDTE